ncbi:MAG: FtsX-like permease family protein [Lachnospiraceae bacterium]
MKGQFIAITIVLLVGAFFYGGISNLAKNLDDYATGYFEASNMADLWIYYSNVSQAEIDEILELDGVISAEGRTVFSAYQNIDDIKATLHVQTLTENVNKTTMIDGSAPYEYGTIGIDSDYASAHELEIGDSVCIIIDDAEINLKISGFIESSEHVIKSRSSSDYPPNHSEYGIAYITSETLAGVSGYNEFNEVIIDAGGDEWLESIGAQAEAISLDSDNTYLYSVQRQANMGYQQTTDEIETQHIVAKFLPVIFFAAAAFIIYIIISRIIDTQRTQIGAMKALGANGRLVIIHYISYAVIIGLIGGTIGAVLGIYLYPQIVMEHAESVLSIPNFELTLDFRYILESVLLSILFGSAASFISAKRNLKENPAQAMRAKPNKTAKPTLLERNETLWTRLQYTDKLIVRNIFTHKIRAGFSIIGIFFCVVLLIMAVGYLGSRVELVDRQYSQVYNFDLRVSFFSSIDSGQLPVFDNTDEYSVSEMAQTNVIITNFTDKKTSNLIALSGDQDCIRHFDHAGNTITPDDSTVIISKRYADAHNLSVGDNLNIKFTDSQYGGVSVDVIIGGISMQYLNQEIYCTFGLLESKDIDLQKDTLLYQIDDELSVDNLYQTYTQMDTVKEVKTLSDLQANTENGLEGLLAMMIVMIICALVLAAAAIYSISTINIQERFRELATLKVLGCQKNKIYNLIFKENMILTIFAVIIGIPAGIVFYLNMLNLFTADSMVFPEYLTVSSVLWPVVITLFVTILCNQLLRKKIKKIDMIESLKVNE